MRALTQPVAATLRRDLGLALGVAALLVVGSDVSLREDLWAQPPGFAGRLTPDTWGLLLILAATLPLTFRRTAPLAVFLTCSAASLLSQAHDRPHPLPLGVLVALYTLAVLRLPLFSGMAVAGYLAALALGAVLGWAPISDDLFYTYVLAVAAAVVLGYGVALGRARASLAEQRAAELAREQETRTQAAVEQEQARIAREVHDIVAHDLSVIVAQAAAAGRVLDAQPQIAGHTLSSIEAVGRDALDGLRRLVGLLRAGSAEGDRSPQPGLERVPWLLAQVRKAGLPVALTVHGRPGPLPATVELNAYRIIQEALTNSLKHAGPARAEVSLDYGEDSLGIEVLDHADPDPDPDHDPDPDPDAVPPRDRAERLRDPRPALASAGYGLISMQQRAAMLGGELVAGPALERGFLVSARLPVQGGAR
jgi:signal transduction histidine kinase